MTVKELRHLIRDTLGPLDLYSEDAEELLVMTCCVESDMGMYDEQHGGGPAKSIFQIEKGTYVDIMSRWLLTKKPAFRDKIHYALLDMDPFYNFESIKDNDAMAVIVARLKYCSIKEKLPSKDNTLAMAHYWKKYYNTYVGRGTVEEALRKYKKYTKE